MTLRPKTQNIGFEAILTLPPPDHRFPVLLFQMTRHGTDEIADIDILCAVIETLVVVTRARDLHSMHGSGTATQRARITSCLKQGTRIVHVVHHNCQKEYFLALLNRAKRIDESLWRHKTDGKAFCRSWFTRREKLCSVCVFLESGDLAPLYCSTRLGV
ncbi:hypothetical protein J6590_024244 [Homalodisca vitripennis]|nr:hypothetical protein J6590_024244 [Homalodisca vitripennis]